MTQYNKLTELLHLSERKSIKALPLNKEQFSLELTRLKTKEGEIDLREQDSPVVTRNPQNPQQLFADI